MNGVDASEMCCDCMSPASPHFQARNCTQELGDTAAWRDSGGYTCIDYDSKQWCGSNGRNGVNWNTVAWGSRSEYADSDGKHSSGVCCACVANVDENTACETGGDESDEPSGEEWRDKIGMSCSDYETLEWCSDGGPGVGWNPIWGLDFSDLGRATGPGTVVDAGSECCACGSTEEGWVSSCCEDGPGWITDQLYTCVDFVAFGICIRGEVRKSETNFGYYRLDADGKDATESCCACGAPALSKNCPQPGSDYLWVSTEGHNCFKLTQTFICLGGEFRDGFESADFLDADGNGPETACCECIVPSSPYYTTLGKAT